MTNLCVVFQSGSGHTQALAQAILKGATGLEGVNAQIQEIRGSDIVEGRFVNDSIAC